MIIKKKYKNILKKEKSFNHNNCINPPRGVVEWIIKDHQFITKV